VATNGKIILFGATSYVGQFFLREFSARNSEVIAVVNNPISARILLAEHPGMRPMTSEELSRSDLGEVRAVINLAYVRTAPPHRANPQNERLLRAVHDAAVRSRCDRVLQASTIAVFGYEPGELPKPVHVPVQPGNFYIEIKARAEHLLERFSASGGYHLSIVRLGNVVGPGSAAWTAGPAQRLLEGKPLGVTGKAGRSNATYVENIASYFAHLSEAPRADLERFGAYHHLTELGAHSWDEFLADIEATVGLRRVLVSGLRARSETPWSHPIGAALKQAYRGRLGGYARSVLGRLPWQGALDTAFTRAKQLDAPESHLRGPAVQVEDLPLLGLLTTDVAIESHTLPGWTPPCSFAAAEERIVAWLRESGYTVGSGN
jgi:nucleoside-diphosphate-sugar epimerase